MTQTAPAGAFALPIPGRHDAGHQITVEVEKESFVQQIIDEMIQSCLIIADDWQDLTADQQGEILRARDEQEVLKLLVQRGLMTQYQSDRVQAGSVYGLVLGNYRVLDRIGAGGMGIVFMAEHILLRRIVAIKVLPISRDQDPRLLRRFLAEMRAVASLQHSNIVSAMDAGQIHPNEPNLPILHYLVMEYVNGLDLEALVERSGPVEPGRVCDLAYQVASALGEAHNHHLVHRDIKPSNILVTAENRAKLLDFGLAQNLSLNLTEPGSLLGTLDYMAPEQAHDPSKVDIRADIYGLGATMYWALTGKVPFPMQQASVSQQVARRLCEPPPAARAHRPEISPELDSLLSRMMAIRPEDRLQTPQSVMRALLPFLRHGSGSDLITPSDAMSHKVWALADAESEQRLTYRVLVVDDEPTIAMFCRAALQDQQITCEDVGSGEDALKAVAQTRYDVILLDEMLPGETGRQILPKLRDLPNGRHARILLMSGMLSPDDLAQALSAGADDYLAKPIGVFQMRSRVKALLKCVEVMRRADVLSHQLQVVTSDLERSVEGRHSDQIQSRQALVQAMIALVQHRTSESPAHLMRVQRYCRILAEETVALTGYAEEIDDAFIQSIETCAPLHDIGLTALPDHILLKPGKLAPDERVIMQSHTVIGAQMVDRTISACPGTAAYLKVARDLIVSHHENFDGTGYPHKLKGTAIPLAARIMAMADVYDALRSRRAYRPALDHRAAVEVILQAEPHRFDPKLLATFQECHAKFEAVAKQIPD